MCVGILLGNNDCYASFVARDMDDDWTWTILGYRKAMNCSWSLVSMLLCFHLRSDIPESPLWWHDMATLLLLLLLVSFGRRRRINEENIRCRTINLFLLFGGLSSSSSSSLMTPPWLLSIGNQSFTSFNRRVSSSACNWSNLDWDSTNASIRRFFCSFSVGTYLYSQKSVARPLFFLTGRKNHYYLQ